MELSYTVHACVFTRQRTDLRSLTGDVYEDGGYGAPRDDTIPSRVRFGDGKRLVNSTLRALRWKRYARKEKNVLSDICHDMCSDLLSRDGYVSCRDTGRDFIAMNVDRARRSETKRKALSFLPRGRSIFRRVDEIQEDSEITWSIAWSSTYNPFLSLSLSISL